MLLSGSCSQEIMGPAGNGNDDPAKAGTVRFKLGGSAGKVMTRAAGDELQTAEEKQVSGLLAVVFRDADGAVTTGTANAEEDTDPFFKAIDVLSGGADLTGEGYTFEIGEPGAYHICFVANPGTELKTGIGAFTEGVSTVNDFKSLVAAQDPGTKPMLMAGTFLGAGIGNTGADLGTVILSRIMARIDIVNMADGVTVTKAVLRNRTVKSLLLSDGFTLDESYLADKEYAGIDIVGDSDPASTTNAYAAGIYSYEQYGASAVGKAPTLELTYKLAGDETKEYRHTVLFKDATDGDVNLERNKLYRVRLRNSGAKLRFNLSVADWNEGEEFEVSGDRIAQGVEPEVPVPDYSQAALGDIMLSDGTLVKADAITEEQKAQAIGIVAFLYSDARGPKDGVRNALAAKKQNNPTGLVLALKNAGTGIVTWGPTNTNAGYALENLNTTYADGQDGYTITSDLAQKNDYIAFIEAVGYEASVSTRGITCTGWYLPSLGEWIDIMGSAGIGNISEVDDLKTSTWSGRELNNKARQAAANLNSHLDKIGGSFVRKFFTDTSISDSYWSSSENSETSAYYLNFYPYGALGFNRSSKDVGRRVRCVLAF